MRKYFLLIAIIVLPVVFSCSSTKDVSERRGFLMPRTSEVPRNSQKFKEIDYRKRDKYKKKKSKSRKKYNKR